MIPICFRFRDGGKEWEPNLLSNIFHSTSSFHIIINKQRRFQASYILLRFIQRWDKSGFESILCNQVSNPVGETWFVECLSRKRDTEWVGCSRKWTIVAEAHRAVRVPTEYEENQHYFVRFRGRATSRYEQDYNSTKSRKSFPIRSNLVGSRHIHRNSFKYAEETSESQTNRQLVEVANTTLNIM